MSMLNEIIVFIGMIIFIFGGLVFLSAAINNMRHKIDAEVELAFALFCFFASSFLSAICYVWEFNEIIAFIGMIIFIFGGMIIFIFGGLAFLSAAINNMRHNIDAKVELAFALFCFFASSFLSAICYGWEFI